MKFDWEELHLTADPVHGKPLARSSHGVSLLCQGTVLVIYGGEHRARTPMDPPTQQTMWKGDLIHQTWKAITTTKDNPCPSPRIAHAQAVHNDKVLYIFGGRSGVDMHETALQDLWAWDVTTETWTEIKPNNNNNNNNSLPEARSFHRMICIKDSLYVFGGCGASGRLADLHCFDIPTRTWQALPLSNLRGRGGPNFACIGSSNDSKDLLLVWAGFAGEETCDGQFYDVNKGAWKDITLPETLRPRSVCVSGTLGEDRVVIFGGEVDPSDKGHEGAGGFCRDVLVLSTKTTELTSGGGSFSTSDNDPTVIPLQIQQSQKSPEPGPCARGWSAGDTIGNSLFLFGGLTGDDANPQRLGDLWKLTLLQD